MAGATRGGGISTVAIAAALVWISALSPSARQATSDLHIETGIVSAVSDDDLVTFNYEFEERPYSARLAWPINGLGTDETIAPPPVMGDDITILVDPAEPTDVRLNIDGPSGAANVVTLAGMLFLVGLRSSFADEQSEEEAVVPVFSGTVVS